jgi:hypothetical protein
LVTVTPALAISLMFNALSISTLWVTHDICI